MANGFVVINFIRPKEYRSMVLNLILQSPFFILNFIAYLLAYTILTIAGALSQL